MTTSADAQWHDGAPELADELVLVSDVAVDHRGEPVTCVATEHALYLVRADRFRRLPYEELCDLTCSPWTIAFSAPGMAVFLDFREGEGRGVPAAVEAQAARHARGDGQQRVQAPARLVRPGRPAIAGSFSVRGGHAIFRGSDGRPVAFGREHLVYYRWTPAGVTVVLVDGERVEVDVPADEVALWTSVLTTNLGPAAGT